MNEQLYKKLGIDSSKDLKDIMSELEDKQFDYLQRAETASDEARKQEISDVLEQIDKEITTVKEQIKALSSAGVNDTEADSTQARKETKDTNEANG